MNGAVGSNRLRSRAAASLDTGGNGGGNVDDILKRLGIVETSVAEIRAVLPHLATRADLNALKTELKDEIHSARSEINLLRADMNATETRMIKWMIGTAISTAALAFSVAKFVH